MKNIFCLVCLAILSSSAVVAQEAELPAPRANNNFLPAPEPPTHFESGYQRYETPQQRVHRNAALRAAQRHERMAINARFGYSPSRPPSSTLPFMGSPIAPPTGYGIYMAYPGFVFPRPYSRF